MTNTFDPLKQARAYCLECKNGSGADIAKCPADFCPLYFLRFGADPRVSHAYLNGQERVAFKKRFCV